MLELFILETCPYSRKVMDFMKAKGISYKKRDIAEPENMDKLIELGGKTQVPFLYDTDNDEKIYDSEEIIEYVKSLNL